MTAPQQPAADSEAPAYDTLARSPVADRTDSTLRREVRNPDGEDAALASIQPGGGVCTQIELAWGRLRRRYLKTFRRGYVARMRAARLGDASQCPVEVIDSRDVKFFQNRCDVRWPVEVEPFAWRDRLPFARPGLAELLIFSTILLALTAAAARLWWPLAVAPLVAWGLVVWFFRNPRRDVPTGAGVVVSPADGWITTVEELEDEFVGRADLVGIFLSIFNVHINRSPVDADVVGVRYRPGKMLNALRPESARENERLELLLIERGGRGMRMRVAQITGAIARRIVCCTGVGRTLARGENFGMIKIGSRTELVLPVDGVRIAVEVGQKVKAGETVIARAEYANS